MAIFCQINQKNQLVDPNVLYSFDGYQKKGIDPNISGKKSLAQSNIRISSYCRFKMSAYGKQAEIFLLSILDLCGHVDTLKKCNFILILIKLVSGQIGKIWPSKGQNVFCTGNFGRRLKAAFV